MIITRSLARPFVRSFVRSFCQPNVLWGPQLVRYFIGINQRGRWAEIALRTFMRCFSFGLVRCLCLPSLPQLLLLVPLHHHQPRRAHYKSSTPTSPLASGWDWPPLPFALCSPSAFASNLAPSSPPSSSARPPLFPQVLLLVVVLYCYKAFLGISNCGSINYFGFSNSSAPLPVFLS